MESKKFYVLTSAYARLTKREMKAYNKFDALIGQEYGYVKTLYVFDNQDEALEELDGYQNSYGKDTELYYVNEYGVQEIEQFWDEDGEVDESKTIWGDWWTARDYNHEDFDTIKEIVNGYHTADEEE